MLFTKTLWGLINNLFTNINQGVGKLKNKISFTGMKKAPDINGITFGALMYYSIDYRECSNQF